MALQWQNGIISTLAGNGQPGYGGDGGPAAEARLNGPAGLALDRAGNVYIAELLNHVVRKVDRETGIISTIAGRGGFGGDGGPAAGALLHGPEGVYVDGRGDIYIADTGNQRIRKIESGTGIIRTVAGCGETGCSGDGGEALQARLDRPAGVVDGGGNIFFNDYGNDRIRRIDPQGIITTYAGIGEPDYSGDGGPADKAGINDVYGLANG